MNTMKVDVITPESEVFTGEAKFVLARATDGDIGIMPNHVPLIAALSVWPLRIDLATGESQELAVFGGFMEVHKEGVSIVATHCELPHEIDVERASRAKARAEERLASSDPEIDMARAEAALRRAMMRLQLAKK